MQPKHLCSECMQHRFRPRKPSDRIAVSLNETIALMLAAILFKLCIVFFCFSFVMTRRSCNGQRHRILTATKVANRERYKIRYMMTVNAPSYNEPRCEGNQDAVLCFNCPRVDSV